MSEENILPWLPLIVAFLTLIGGAVVYNVQRAVDRKNKALEERRELYREVVEKIQILRMEAFVNSFQNEKKYGHFRDFTTLLAKITITSPDHVVEAAKSFDSEFRKAMKEYFSKKVAGEEEPEVDRKHESAAFENLILEMRKDTFEDTSVGSISLDISYFGMSVGFQKS